jgi:hypothetical protein
MSPPYGVRSVRLTVSRDRGFHRQREVIAPVLLRHNVLVVEDPAARVELARGERISRMQVKPGFPPHQHWCDISLPVDGADLRQVASEIPQARAVLLKEIMAAIATADTGKQALKAGGCNPVTANAPVTAPEAAEDTTATTERAATASHSSSGRCRVACRSRSSIQRSCKDAHVLQRDRAPFCHSSAWTLGRIRSHRPTFRGGCRPTSDLANGRLRRAG